MKSYLDHNATSPLDSRVFDAMSDVHRRVPGNPSSLHAYGRAARRVIEDARAEIAELMGVSTRRVVFTSGATEANNQAIASLGKKAPKNRRRILASPIEHPSVLAPLDALTEQGFEIDWIEVSREGLLDCEGAAKRLGPEHAFVTAMAANNETGVLQDLAPLGEACRREGVFLHADAAQVLGRHSIEPTLSAAHIVTFSSHKHAGPLGVGWLTLPQDQELDALIQGGGQERGRRAGTENVPAIHGAAQAAMWAHRECEHRASLLRSLETHLLDALSAEDIHYELNTKTAPRLPGSLSLRFSGHVAETLLMKLDLHGVAVSAGSACSAGSIEASHVLRAMGFDLKDNHASIRVSMAATTTKNEIKTFVDAMRIIDQSRRNQKSELP